MKLFNFTLLALGVMFIMYLAGVGNTNSSLILNSILLKNTTQITSSSALPTAGVSVSSFISFDNWWIAIAILLGGAFLFSGIKISIGNYISTPSIDVVYVALAGGIFSIFVMDIVSLLNYIGSITNYSGWTFWVIAGILIPFAVMYSFSLFSFLKGND